MKRSFPLTGLDYYDLEGSIGDVIDTLQKFKTKHPTAHISLDAYDDYGSASISMSLTETREETPEELKKRIADEAARAALRERHERLQFEALKKKFGEA